MRLVATEYLSLDGVFEEPGHWSFPFFGPDVAQFKWDELQSSDALLLGRKTYAGFAAAWPTMSGTGEFGEKMNSMPKYVVSSTLRDFDWSGSRKVEGELESAIASLKESAGNDLLLSGSGQLFNALMRSGQIDLCRLMVHPIVLGSGEKLFEHSSPHSDLKLVNAKTFESGVVVLEYTPAGK